MLTTRRGGVVIQGGQIVSHKTRMRPDVKLVFLLFVIGQTSTSEDVWTVDLKQGSIEVPKTKAADGTHFYVFKGIPFAEPPVGDLRFKSPVPAGPWSGIRNGSVPSPICPQIDLMGFLTGVFQASGDEDCLYLDVYVPEKKASDFPVMVWIHGGGFVLGGASDYGASPLMAQDIIVVMIQYRLGALGFLSTEDSVMSGNYGLKDQVLALRWVQDNIQSFGGDQNRVTLFGESAGGMSVHYLMLSPMSEGLFHRAIAQSGTALVPLGWGDNSRQNAATLGQMLNCSEVNPDNLNSQALLDCLKKISPEKLVRSSKAFATFMGIFPEVMHPTIDGEFLPEHPAQMLKKGNYHKVNFMTGITRDEGAMMMRLLMMNEPRREELANNISSIGPLFLGIETGSKASPGYVAKRMFAHYIGDFKVTEDNTDGAVKLFTDHWFAVPLDISGRMHARDSAYGQRTYLYELHHHGEFSFIDSPNITEGKDWVAHGDDLMYLFTNNFQPPISRPNDLFVRQIMISLWTNFARTGNPTPDMSLGFKWLPVSTNDQQCLILQPSPYMRKFTRDQDSSETVNTEDQADTSIKEIEQEDHGQSFRTPRNPPKRARKSEDSPANEAVKCMKSLTQIVSAKDENSAFGEFVANKMKSCNRPRVEISLAQRYINNILFRLDMGLLSGDIQSMYKSHTYPTSIPSYSPLPDSPQFSGHPSPIQPCSPLLTVSGSPVPPQQSQFSGHPSPIQPCSPVPIVSGSPVPPQQSQSLAGTLNNPFNFLDL